ncbi:glutamate receptor ionotropic, kainate glr-3-like [Procambarus clarkii]|uniref:glutamate receptor ionotropic, kainate glr-3-like n=1 Tax=Procambarus clarkii TaxID=6728 RepID=UPI00374314FC
MVALKNYIKAMAAIVVNAVPLVSQEVGVMVGQVGVMVGQVVERHLTGCHLVLITTSRHSHVSSSIIRRWNGDMEAGVIVEAGPVTSQDQLDHLLQGQDQLDHLLQGLWTDARTTCRGLVLDLTSNNNTSHILEFLEMSGLWKLPETVVIAIGGRAGVRAVLLHHSLRNTVHALYLALHHDLYLALHHASLYAIQVALHNASLHISSHFGTSVAQRPKKQAESSSCVLVYRRCLYCNTGEPDVQLVHRCFPTSPTLPMDHLFHEQFHNLLGHKIKFSSMIFFPYMDYRSNNNEQGSSMTLVDSLNTRLFLDFARRLNVSFEVQEQPEHSWGVEKAGKFSGMMGQLQREEIDVCGPLAPHNERIKVMEFLNVYKADMMKIVSLKPTSLPQHLSPIRPFSGELWVALLVSVVAWGTTLWLQQRVWQWSVVGLRVELSAALLYSWGALLQTPPTVPSVSSSGRVLVGTWLVFCVVMITGYSSSLMAHLTIVGKTTPPETFEDLVSRENWKWGIESYMLNGAVILYFTKHSDPVVKEIYRKMEALTITEALEKVKKGGYSFLSMNYFISITVASRYADKYGQTPFYISKNEITLFISFGLGFRKGSPLFPRFEQLVQRLVISGIMQHWTDELVAKRVRDEKEAAQQDHSVLLDNTTHDDTFLVYKIGNADDNEDYNTM